MTRTLKLKFATEKDQQFAKFLGPQKTQESLAVTAPFVPRALAPELFSDVPRLALPPMQESKLHEASMPVLAPHIKQKIEAIGAMLSKKRLSFHSIKALPSGGVIIRIRNLFDRSYNRKETTHAARYDNS